MAKVYINLPVTDLVRSTAFYEALGFTKYLEFSSDDASGMIWDENFMIMLLTYSFAKGYLPAGKTIADSRKTCEVLNAIQFDSRAEVDTFFEKAIAAGGQKTIDTYDHGFIYGRDFEDPDGHIWEAFWMDISQMPKE
jgi:uncharacterized protein